MPELQTWSCFHVLYNRCLLNVLYFLNLQFIADTKLLYDLDTSGMGEKLLRIYDRVVKEASSQCKEYDTIMEAYKRQVENLSGETLNGDWTDELIFYFAATRLKLVSLICM